MSPYLHDCWWRNKPPTTIQEAKPEKESVPSEAEASPPPRSLTVLNLLIIRFHNIATMLPELTITAFFIQASTRGFVPALK